MRGSWVISASSFSYSLSRHWQFAELVVSLHTTFNNNGSCFLSSVKPSARPWGEIVCQKDIVPASTVIVA